MKSVIVNAIRVLERRDPVSGQSVLLAEDVVQAARSPDSPLHRFFEWDDSKAAHQYRVSQARKLIQQVQVWMPLGDGTRTRVHVYHHVPQLDREGYRRIEQIGQVESQREALIRQLRGEVAAFREKYARYASVLEAPAIEEALSTLEEAITALVPS